MSENDRHRERYHWYADQGICPQCGQEYSAVGHVYCTACLKKLGKRLKKYDPTGQRSIQRKKEVRAFRKANHLCYDCGKPTGGPVRCPACTIKDHERQQVYRIKKKLEKQINETRRNLCYDSKSRANRSGKRDPGAAGTASTIRE